ncbi:hypothetical protein N7456_008811 [Penicillium angulare]|uniref:HTH CENPB-type domain-containing protein n=1 Tax=Penicillium angulare TaxID=116970 RepID=A0A9W9F3R8_9EURO|nr:hypothetical protein N7456_008811 [Penicillium angulare]
MDIESGGTERQQPQWKKNKPKLTDEEEDLVAENVERYIDHGFPVKKEGQILEIALLSLKEHAKRNDEQFPKTLSMAWVKGFFQRHPDLERKFLQSRDEYKASNFSTFRQDPDTLLGFLDVIDKTRDRYPFANENVYTVGELGFIPLIRSERQSLIISRPDGVVCSDREPRDFHSVIHCLTYGGKYLDPFILTSGHQKASKRQLKGTRVQVVLDHKKRWADEAHLLNWVKSIFDPSTKQNVENNDEYPWRLLLVDGNHLGSYTEIEMVCFSMKIICLSFPRKSCRFISPLYGTSLEAVGKSWADAFRKKFRNSGQAHLQLSMKEFVSSIQTELSSHHRQIENHGAWLNSCLLPPNRRGLLRLLVGTQMPETPRRNANQESTLASPRRTETPSPLDTAMPTPDFEISSNENSPEYSPPPTMPPIEEALLLPSSVYGGSGKRARTPEYADAEAPPSKRKFLDHLNSLENATSPREIQRCREEVVTAFVSVRAQADSLWQTLNLVLRSSAATPKSPYQ